MAGWVESARVLLKFLPGERHNQHLLLLKLKLQGKARHGSVKICSGECRCSGLLRQSIEERDTPQGEFTTAGGRGSASQGLNFEQPPRSIFIDCYTKVDLGEKQVPDPKAPNLIYVFPTGKHHITTTMCESICAQPAALSHAKHSRCARTVSGPRSRQGCRAPSEKQLHR